MRDRILRIFKWIPVAMVGFAGTAMSVSNLIFLWLRQYPCVPGSACIRPSWWDWMVAGEGAAYGMQVLGDVGIGLIGAAVFLVGVQSIMDRRRKLDEIAERNESLLNEVLMKLRRGGADTDQALQQLRAAGDPVKDGLRGALLAGLDFKKRVLDGLRFIGADLTNARFDGASMVGIQLQGANLSGAVLEGSKLSFANLAGATVSDAQLKRAHGLWQATLPDGSLYMGSWQLSGDLAMAQKMGIDIGDPAALAAFYRTNTK